ncbi:MAG: response regulator [Anaerolineales bacterium]
MTSPFSILIVDDNPSIASTLEDILEVKGFEVLTANSGAEALEILRAHPVNILLTDVKMPDMDGLALYREARQIQPAPYTIFMTAYAADDLIRQGLEEGIKTVLTKPLDIEFLLLLFFAIQRLHPQAG